MSTATSRPGAAAGADPRRLLQPAGWLTAAVVVVDAVLAGLPGGTGAATATVLLTVVAVALWLVSLARRVTDLRLLAAALLGTGLAGAALDRLHPTGPGFVLAYMAMAGLGLRLPRRPAVAAAAAVVLAAGWAEAVGSDHPVGAALTVVAGSGFLFLAASYAAVSRDAHERSRGLLAQEAATRAAREEAAVLAERGRLARELHDVLAHTLSGLALQLEGARLLAERTGADPRLTGQLAHAQRLAREGMTSAHRAVATLRGEPLPGLADLRALVERTRRSGVPVTLTEVGPPRPLPAESGLAVYRVVQEALTNAAKHGGRGAGVTVALTWTADDLLAEVVDAGGERAGAGDLPSGGYGLAGLGERAALAGGRLDAGPTPDGWRVALWLPSRPGAVPAQQAPA